jgi:hypothetical protein
MTDAREEALLAACPFCGGEASVIGIRDGRQVSCKGPPRTPCFAKGPAVYHGPAGWEACEAEAIAAWNRRASPAPSLAVGEQARKLLAAECAPGPYRDAMLERGFVAAQSTVNVASALRAIEAALAAPAQQAEEGKLRTALTHAQEFISKLTADISDRVYRADECGDATAWENVDEGKYDGTWASYRDEINDALANKDTSNAPR